MNYSKPFHVLLTEARLMANMSQKELAERAGTTPALISKYSSGTSKPRPETVEKIASVLGLDVERLLASLSDAPDFIELPYLYSDLSVEGKRFLIDPNTLKRTFSPLSESFAYLQFGNAMSPTINDGDTVVVSSYLRRILDGKMFLCSFGGLIQIKRIYQSPHQSLRLVSDNKEEFPEIVIAAEHTQDFKVIGQVIWRSGFV